MVLGLVALASCGKSAGRAHDHEGHDHGVGAVAHDHAREGHDHEAEVAAHGAGASDEIVVSPEKAEAAGIVVETVRPAAFREVIATSGQVLPVQGSERTLVANLQKKQKSLQSEISRKRKQADKLNAQIDRLIEAEIEAARKLAAKKGGKSSSSGKATASGSKARPMDAYKVDDDNRKLSGSFEKNKGRLPVPITGGYMVVSHYGRHNVAGLKHVEIDNKGVDIKGRSGAQARAVFDGEVSAVFQYNGMTNVLVRHGSYISVYCNLSSASVQRGQKVKARQSLGPVATDASGNIILHFQLRREKEKLNPEPWLAR